MVQQLRDRDASEPPGGHRVVVKFTAGAADVESRAAQLADGLPGGRVVRVSPRGRAVLALDASADLADAARRLSAEDDVEYAEPDAVDRAQGDR